MMELAINVKGGRNKILLATIAAVLLLFAIHVIAVAVATFTAEELSSLPGRIEEGSEALKAMPSAEAVAAAKVRFCDTGNFDDLVDFLVKGRRRMSFDEFIKMKKGKPYTTRGLRKLVCEITCMPKKKKNEILAMLGLDPCS